MTSVEQNESVFEFDPADWAGETDHYAPYMAAAASEKIRSILSQTTTDKKTLEPQSGKENVELSDRKKDLVEMVAVMLATHLYNVYAHKLETTLNKEGITAIDTTLPYLELAVNESGTREVTFSLTFEDVHKNSRQLQQLIEASFQGSRFWHECFRSIQVFSFAWAAEAMEQDIGVDLPDSENEHEGYFKTLFDYYSSDSNESTRSLYKLYSREITKFLVEGMDLPKRSLAELEMLMGLRKRKPAEFTEPRLCQAKFSEPCLSTAITQTVFTAGVNGWKFWETSETRLNGTKDFSKGRVELQIRDKFEFTDFAEIAYKAKEVIAHQFGEETLKLHYALSAIAFRKEAPWTDEITVSLSKLLADFGENEKKNRYVSKRDAEKSGQLTQYVSKEERLLRQANQARLLKRIEVWVPEWRATKKRTIAVEMSNLWDIFGINVITELSTSREKKIVDIEITYRPGLWFRRFAGNKHLREFGYLTSEMLKLDPVQDRMALRLVYFALTNLQQHKSGRFKIRELLDHIGYGTEIQAALTKPSTAWSLERAFKRALQTLGNFQHPYRFELDPDAPEWAKLGSKTKKPDRWFEIWQELPGTLHQPDTLPVHKNALTEPEKLLTRQTARKSSAIFDPLVFGQQVRQARKQKGETLTAMAESLKISKTQLSQIENGRYPTTINSNVKAQILDYLGLSD